MKENNYITIPGFLRTRLNLKGSELIITALIYGYSQDGNSWFIGKAGYIAEWAGITDKNVLRILKSLTEKGILEKKEMLVNNKAKRCYYRFNFECVKSQSGIVAKSQSGIVDESQSGIVAESQSGIVAKSQSGIVAKSQSGIVAKSQSGIVAESQSGIVAKSQSGIVAKSQSGIVAESQSGIVAESQSGIVDESQSGIVAKSQSGIVDESQSGIVAESQSGIAGYQNGTTKYQNGTEVESQNGTINNNIYNNNIYNNKEPENEFSVFFDESQQSNTLQKLRGTTEPRKCLFANSRFAKFDDFKRCFDKPEFEQIDILYYYHAVADWSASKGRMQKDWIAQTRNFIRGDKEKGKLHLKPEYKSPTQGLDVAGAIEYLNDDY